MHQGVSCKMGFFDCIVQNFFVIAWISNLLYEPEVSFVWPTQESGVSFELKSVRRPLPSNMCDDEIISTPWHWMQSRSSDVLALQPSAEEVLKPLRGLFSWLAASCSSEDHLSSLVVASDQSWEDNLSSSRPNTRTGVMKCPQGQMWPAAFKDNRPDAKKSCSSLTFFRVMY